MVAAVTNRIAEALSAEPLAPAVARLPLGPVPPGGWASPWIAGLVHEQVATAKARKSRGAWYTPRSVVEGLVRLATIDGMVPDVAVDLTCGGGAFLLALLDRLVGLGLSPAEAVERVGGMDLDADAVEVSRWSVMLWAVAKRQSWSGATASHPMAPTDFASSVLQTATRNVHLGDALVDRPSRWASGPGLLVGNPPFGSPLKKGAIPSTAVVYRQDRSEMLGPYADLAAIHLSRAVELAGQGSRVTLIQPQSVLSSRDTQPMRQRFETTAPTVAMWAAREPVFDAGVRACAPILHVGGPRAETVALASGPGVDPGPVVAADRWSYLAADALGAPTLPVMQERRLGEVVSATAGFRDEYYGLVAACREGDGPLSSPVDAGTARLVTVGSLEPLQIAWGRRPCRFGGTDWLRPVVDRAGLSAKVGAWFDRQACPKVLLATQTKILEPMVDRSGSLVPVTPVVAIHCAEFELDRVAAVLLAPPVVLWAWREWLGSALSVDAVKVAARQVADLPLPSDDDRWREAAALVASADHVEPQEAWQIVIAVARLMTDAYGASSEVFDWWLARAGGRANTEQPA